MNTRLFLGSLALATLIAGAAMAQLPDNRTSSQVEIEGQPVPSAPSFDLLDKNGDDKISAEEARDSWLAKVFAQVDSDQDESVSAAEYQQATN